jgi:15-cis-phytoene synthase
MSQGILDTAKPTDLDACYDYCRAVTHRHGPNFSVGFRFLPVAKRNAVYAVYAFCRFADDMADEVGKGDPKQLLDAWDHALESCYNGVADHPILVALSHSAQLFDIPAEPFHRLIEGCRTDLVKVRYETFDNLLVYCDQVATTISELSLSIFGWNDPQTPELGCNLSTALQLTNIIRDVAEDFGRGRIYLPLEDLRRFEVGEDELDGSGSRDRFRALMDFQVKRALEYFEGARGIVGVVEPDSRLAVALMGGVYYDIAQKIKRDVEAVLSERVALSIGDKVQLAAKMFGWNLVHKMGLAAPPVW